MFDSLEHDTNSLYPTDFDILKLQNMNLGDKINAESRNWSVIKYKESYTLMLSNHPKLPPVLDFLDLKSLIYFLKKS
jgi:hypothetical protein